MDGVAEKYLHPPYTVFPCEIFSTNLRSAQEFFCDLPRIFLSTDVSKKFGLLKVVEHSFVKWNEVMSYIVLNNFIIPENVHNKNYCILTPLNQNVSVD